MINILKVCIFLFSLSWLVPNANAADYDRNYNCDGCNRLSELKFLANSDICKECGIRFCSKCIKYGKCINCQIEKDFTSEKELIRQQKEYYIELSKSHSPNLHLEHIDFKNEFLVHTQCEEPSSRCPYVNLEKPFSSSGNDFVKFKPNKRISDLSPETSAIIEDFINRKDVEGLKGYMDSSLVYQSPIWKYADRSLAVKDAIDCIAKFEESIHIEEKNACKRAWDLLATIIADEDRPIVVEPEDAMPKESELDQNETEEYDDCKWCCRIFDLEDSENCWKCKEGPFCSRCIGFGMCLACQKKEGYPCKEELIRLRGSEQK